MDEHRIEDALRAGPPDEPAYVPGRTQAQGGDADALAVGARPSTEAEFGSRIRRPDSRISVRARASGLRFVTSIAAVLAIVVVAFALRVPNEPGASPTPGDLLARIRAAGAIRIAVSNEAPQTSVAGGSFIGFDVDVAEAIAGQLGVRADLQFLAPEEIFSPNETWDVALPSRVVPDRPFAAVTAASYYDWPEWLVVAPDSPASAIVDLAGRTICVVDGSPAGDWLAGNTVSSTTYALQPPADATPLRAASDSACFDAVDRDEADAAVTASLLDLDVASRGLRLLVTDPLIVQHRVMLVRDLGSTADPASLVRALEDAIAELRTTGELADLSREAFGGRDLTEPAP